jgi:predicted TIM-barrel fold metal-dependent hydrolase
MSPTDPRAIDIHVHPSTEGWLDQSMGPYIAAAEEYFRSDFARRSLDDLAAEYRRLGILGVLLGWDAETATERPRVPNELIASACTDNPDAFLGFGSVDPWKGETAVAELDTFPTLGLRGLKLHPSLQAFDPDDERHWPIFARCQELGLVCLLHTGTSGVGVGRPGGAGIRLDHSRPIRIDAPAAAFPDLQIIAAHCGWPWHAELLAIAAHKSNVWIDISGWAPRHLPAEIVGELSGRIADRFLFGSDSPFVPPERCLREIADLGLTPEVEAGLLRGNATRLLGLDRA